MRIFQEFLSQVLKATEQGRLQWQKNSGAEFSTTGRNLLVIRQITPLVAGPTETIGPQGFEVQVAGVSFAVWEGSECCVVIREILAKSFPEWEFQQKQIAERLAKVMKDL